MHSDLFRIIGSDVDKSGPDLPRAPRQYRWSNQLWSSRRGDWVALYRPLNLAVIYFQRHLLENVEALDTEESALLQMKLIADKFLISEAENCEILEHEALITAARQGRFRFICILPTTACSMSCRYCHQHSESSANHTMTIAEITQGMEKAAVLCDDLNKPVDILLYGGEPLLAFPLT
jgi:hypothetical protein